MSWNEFRAVEQIIFSCAAPLTDGHNVYARASLLFLPLFAHAHLRLVAGPQEETKQGPPSLLTKGGSA